MAIDYLPDFIDAVLAQFLRANLSDIGLCEQTVDTAQFLQFTLMQNRNSVAHVLDVGQQVAAHYDGRALVAQPQDHVFHFPRADGVQAARGLVEQN
jgi:hypothetical protein